MDPVKEYGTIPKWIWNVEKAESMTREQIDAEMRGFAEADLNRGVMFVLWNNRDYGTETFFERYRWGLESCRKYGLAVTFWDENGFPSGQAARLFKEEDIAYRAWRLDMETVEIPKGQTGEIKIELGERACLMAAVAVETVSRRRREVPCENGILRYTAEEDSLLCAFVCRPDALQTGLFNGDAYFVNYLEAEATDELIRRTYQVFYDRFGDFFGTTIRYAFYDEPSMYHVTGGRAWTRHFNEIFEKEKGYSPALLYPALFMDIGEDTASARCELFGLRARLYAENYVGRLSAWCDAHGLQLTGHTDQEEIPNQTMLSGDLMYSLSRQRIPGVDSIFAVGRSDKPFRVVGSIPWNFGNERVMCEVYGAMSERLPIADLYREGMSMLGRGINFIVPHGTWFDNEKNVIFPPELSYRSHTYGGEMPALNVWFARCCRYLSGGEEETGLGVYVPVENMDAGQVFDDKFPAYLGGRTTSSVGYMDIGEQLIRNNGCEVVYVHPLSVKNGSIRRLKGLVLPEMDVISADSLIKIVEFAENGGRVYAASRLPVKSAEPGRDEEVKALCRRLMQLGVGFPAGAPKETFYSDDSLQRLILRKKKDGKRLCFFANMDIRPSRGELSLPGETEYRLYDPHRNIYTVPCQRQKDGWSYVTVSVPVNECRILLEGKE